MPNDVIRLIPPICDPQASSKWPTDEVSFFILATTHEEKIPTTVRSRCLKFFLQKPDSATLMGYLQNLCHKKNIKFSDEVLEVLITQAQGSYRDLLNIFEYSLAVSGEKQLQDVSLLKLFSHLSSSVIGSVIESMLSSNIETLKVQLEDILSKGEFSPKKFIQQFLAYLSSQENFSPATPGLYTEISKIYPMLSEHPDPKNYVMMSFLRIALLIAKKKAAQSRVT